MIIYRPKNVFSVVILVKTVYNPQQNVRNVKMKIIEIQKPANA